MNFAHLALRKPSLHRRPWRPIWWGSKLTAGAPNMSASRNAAAAIIDRAEPLAAPRDVDASVNYLADLSVKTVTYNPPPGTGVPRREGNYQNFMVRVHNARPYVGDLSLDRQAFILTKHDTKMRDFYDEQELRATYYKEVEELIKRETGAAKVVVFDHTVRTADRAVERGLRTPVRSVHNDYTEKSGPQRVRDLLALDEAEVRLKKRFAE